MEVTDHFFMSFSQEELEGMNFNFKFKGSYVYEVLYGDKQNERT